MAFSVRSRIFTIFCVVFVVSGLLARVGLIVSHKEKYNKNKSSAYECGLDSRSQNISPLSLRLLLLAVIFVVFDVEIALLVALPSRVIEIAFRPLISAVILGTILLIGLAHE